MTDSLNSDAVTGRQVDGLPIPGPEAIEQEQSDQIDSAVPTRGDGLLPVVGLGGSAGSVPALRTFFENAPAAAGLAYVVVLHLAPEHESILPALLQRHSALPVRTAQDGDKLEADHVYVIPPGRNLVTTGGHLRLTEMEHERGKRVVVDLFFRSLADTHGPHATAVVLSGADGDGAIGIKRIKERGGLTIAQDPQEAEHGGMPSAAIATGMVDWILKSADMPRRIVAYVASERRLKLPPEEGQFTTVNAEFRNRVEQLAHANSDLHNLMSATQIATVFLDHELQVMRYTPSAAPLFNLLPGDVGRPIAHLHRRIDYPELTADARQVLRTLVPVERELREDGRWFLARVLPYRRVDDPIAGVVLTFVDITERRSAEQALRESEKSYRTLFESMDEGYLLADVVFDEQERAVDIAYVESNPAATRMVGGNLAGKRLRDLSPDYEDYWYEIWGRVAVTGQGERLERYASPEGRWYDFYVFKPEPANRDSRRVAVLFQDVTERKRTEERQAFLLGLSDTLRSLEDPLEIQATTARMLGAHLRADRSMYAEVEGGPGAETGTVRGQYVRPAPAGEPSLATFPDRYAYAPYGALSIASRRSGKVLVVADVHTDPAFEPAERAAWDAAEVRAAVVVPLVKSGRLVAEFGVHATAPRAWTADEVALVTDVAERTWSAAERAHAEAALRETDRRKDEFLATLAHELRNPLAPIHNALHMLRQGGKGDAAALHATLERQVGHLTRLVDDLMDVSRISRGVIELRRERLDLGEVLHTAIETSRPAIERGRHAFALVLSDEPLPVEGDAVRLAQLVANLLNNAARYTDEGGHIELAARRDGEEVVVTVRDDGIGIAPGELPRVFEPFTQLHGSQSRSHGGLGIGLNLAQRLAQMHGGSLQAASAGAGHGSTFTVRLPLAAQVAAPAPAVAQPDAPIELQAQRVLIVDDNRDAAETLALVLADLGAETRVETDGASALALLEHWRPSAVLLDLGMPDMDGYEVARRIRAQPALDGVVLVALTGWGQRDDRQRTLEAGFAHHLVKPVDLEALEALLATLPSSANAST